MKTDRSEAGAQSRCLGGVADAKRRWAADETEPGAHRTRWRLGHRPRQSVKWQAVAEADLTTPPGVSIERWASGSEVQVIRDLRDAGTETSHVIWMDIAGATDWGALADLLDVMALPGYERAMLGHLLQGVGPDDHGAEAVD